MKSAYKGVVWNRGSRKWVAQIRVGTKNKYLGAFVDQTEAAMAYDIAAKTYFGPKAKLNFGRGSS